MLDGYRCPGPRREGLPLGKKRGFDSGWGARIHLSDVIKPPGIRRFGETWYSLVDEGVE
jgi:hypothetical protein